MSIGTPWSEQENDALRKISECGGTIKDALAILKGRTQNAIFSKAANQGLSFAGGPKEIDMDAFKRFLKGKGK